MQEPLKSMSCPIERTKKPIETQLKPARGVACCRAHSLVTNLHLMSRSTRGNPSKVINWLFFNPVNIKSTVYQLSVSGHSLDTAVDSLGWQNELRSRFKFKADKIEYWLVGC
jgi:hypothetical protein